MLIDPEVKGQDREVIAKVMSQLPPEERENVLCIDARQPERSYSNRAVLNRDLPEDCKCEVPTPDNGYNCPGVKVRAIPLPRDPIGCEFSRGSGGLFGVHSEAGSNTAPLSRSEAIVRFPSKNSEISYGDKEGAYLMLGGWGDVSYGGGPVAVDAGAMFNFPDDSWSTFVKVDGRDVTPVAYGCRLAPKGTHTMRFSVPEDGKVQIELPNGVLKRQMQNPQDPAHPITRLTTVVTSPAAGWRADGIGNVLKMETGLGQEPENLANGSYLKNVDWTVAKLGHGLSMHEWRQNAEYGVCYNPRGKILIDGANGDYWWQTYTNYRVSINLCPATSCF